MPIMQKPFQRIGSKSNSQVGRDFEEVARSFFASKGVHLVHGKKVAIGISGHKKLHNFDLGCEEKKWLVECKSHRWTSGRNVPSAKMTIWNEAMLYFYAAPNKYKKIMFVLKDMNTERNETLLQYYMKTYFHLIPRDVEFWEFDEETGSAARVGI